MKLSDGEKLALLMLADIYEKSGVKGEMEPQFIRSAIMNDQTWALEWRYSGIPFERKDRDPVLDKVVKIVEMWAMMERAYDGLSQSDKDRVQEEAKPFGRDVKFRGFDGNNESEYFRTVRFLVNELKEFQIFFGRDFDTHMPLLDAYDRMFDAYEPIRATLTVNDLSADHLIRILKEMVHPQHRV